MRRIYLSAFLACFALLAAAQETIRVNYQGARPTISDFATAFLEAYDCYAETEEIDEMRCAMRGVWTRHRKGEPLFENEELLVDQKNGYICWERLQEDDYLDRVDMCYWNESDGKHKLFAYNVTCFKDLVYDGGQFDGIIFFRYNNATKKMTRCPAPGFQPTYMTDDGARVSYALPRTGKDLYYTEWDANGKKKEKTLKWDGRKFSF